MKYYCGLLAAEIDKNDYEDYKESNEILKNCLSLERSYDILLSDYIDLEKSHISQAAISPIRYHSLDDIFQIRLSLDRLMLHFLATARQHIGYLGRWGGNSVRGKSSKDVQEVVSGFRNTEIMDKPECKVMWLLRNEILHSNLPVDWIALSQKRVESLDTNGSDTEFEHTLKFGLLKSSFSYCKGRGAKNKRCIKKALEKISVDDKIDLMALSRIYMESISIIQEKFRDYISESVSWARNKMEGAFRHYKEMCNDDPRGLDIWKENEQGDTEEESHLSLYFDDCRIGLQKKNSKIVNLRNRYATGR